MFIENTSIAQDSGDSAAFIDRLSNRTLNKLTSHYAQMSRRIDKSSSYLLHRLQAKETKLQDEVAVGDSSKSISLFAGSASQYQEIQLKLQAKERSEITQAKGYIPGLDSIQSALGFLKKNSLNIPSGKLAKIQQLTEQLQRLQTSFSNAGDIEDFARQREALLQGQLPQMALEGPLLGINKDLYYYRQEVAQYKAIINNSDRMRDAVLSIVRKVPAFEQYWQRYSLLAQLFPLPTDYGTPAALNGLQTTAQVTALVQQGMGGSLPVANTGSIAVSGAASSSPALPEEYIQQAQNQLGQLKDKINQAAGSSSNMTVPNFTPNSQHGRRFLQRLTYGFNLQTASASTYLPAIADLALTIGYKMSDKIRAGAGVSYKLGMGKFSCIQFTNEGIGVRSFLDIKARGSIWITGGWEYSYLQRFKDLQDLHKTVSLWQKSALIGLGKRYSIGKKEGNLQLLYDLLAGEQKPTAQAIKFRTGINF